MQERDRRAFADAYGVLARRFNKNPLDTLESDYRDLSGFTIDEVLPALEEARRTSDNFPRIKALIALASQQRGQSQAVRQPTDNHQAHCPTCGGTPAFRHRTLGRMHIVHVQGFPCERYNRPPPDEVADPEVERPHPPLELGARKADTLKALRGGA